jgi:integrase
MKSSFHLKNPKGEKESLIYFSAYFKNEGKKLIYSTGETILPKEWEFKNRMPNDLSGRTTRADNHRTINVQLNRYTDFYIKIINRYIHAEEDITIENIRNEFDKEFKKTKTGSRDFFSVYDKFMTEKINDKTDKANSTSTIKRYEYNKKLLQDFEESKDVKLNFNQIDKKFYNTFINYCTNTKNHSTNTLSRNIGLFKTFMNWAVLNRYTYKLDFQEFKNIKKEITDEVALSKEQVVEIFNFDFSNNQRLERVRDLFVFGCFTGMRYSNYSKIKKNDIIDSHIKVRDVKDNRKQLNIPLNDYSSYLLKKYDYRLPEISNQKFNEYIKEVIKIVGYTENIKKTSKLGNEIIETVTPFYERISSHTARRSFITIMKTEKVPDKIIMGFTGHKSLEVFNQYYKPNDIEKVDFMQDVFKMNSIKLKKI